MLLSHVPLGVQALPEQLPLVVEWSIEVEDQTHSTVSPTLIVWLAGTKAIELFGPTSTVTVIASRDWSWAPALLCKESRRIVRITSTGIERRGIIST